MQWIAPSEKDGATGSLEKSLWDARSSGQDNEELETLNGQARDLAATIAKNAAEILET
jgi:hypothetical protein